MTSVPAPGIFLCFFVVVVVVDLLTSDRASGDAPRSSACRQEDEEIAATRDHRWAPSPLSLSLLLA